MPDGAGHSAARDAPGGRGRLRGSGLGSGVEPAEDIGGHRPEAGPRRGVRGGGWSTLPPAGAPGAALPFGRGAGGGGGGAGGQGSSGRVGRPAPAPDSLARGGRGREVQYIALMKVAGLPLFCEDCSYFSPCCFSLFLIQFYMVVF